MLIGINGEIGCGKSTATKYLEAKYGMTEYMFAGPLKAIAIAMGFEHHQIYGTQEQKLEINKFWGISGRRFLQVFGSEVCRDFLPTVLPQMASDRGVWIKLFQKFYSENSEKHIVVSDVRFGDESAALRELSGYVVRIVRPMATSAVTSAASSVSSTAVHKSETQADNIHPYAVIINDGTLEDLYVKLDQVVENIFSQNVWNILQDSFIFYLKFETKYTNI